MAASNVREWKQVILGNGSKGMVASDVRECMQIGINMVHKIKT